MWISNTEVMLSCDSSDYNCYHGYLAAITCCFGIITNIINIVVWSRQQNQSSVNLILKILSVTNLLTLTASLVYVSYTFLATGPHITRYHSAIGVYSLVIANHASIVCMNWSSWNVIVLAFFRFIKICFPLQARDMCTIRRAKVTLVLVFVIVILASFVNFFYYDVVPCVKIEHNESCHGYWLKKSNFVTDGGFYDNAFLFVLAVFSDLLPLILFIFLCIGMIISLIKLARNRNIRVNSDFCQKTVGLFVLLFLLTASLLPIVVYDFSNMDAQFFFIMDGFANINLLALVQYLIASIDILIYIPMSRGYRRELRRLFCCGNDDQDDKNEEDNGPRVMWPAEMTPLFE